jgi:hypothetical protein
VLPVPLLLEVAELMAMDKTSPLQTVKEDTMWEQFDYLQMMYGPDSSGDGFKKSVHYAATLDDSCAQLLDSLDDIMNVHGNNLKGGVPSQCIRQVERMTALRRLRFRQKLVAALTQVAHNGGWCPHPSDPPERGCTDNLSGGGSYHTATCSQAPSRGEHWAAEVECAGVWCCHKNSLAVVQVTLLFLLELATRETLVAFL